MTNSNRLGMNKIVTLSNRSFQIICKILQMGNISKESNSYAVDSLQVSEVAEKLISWSLLQSASITCYFVL